MDSKNEKKKPIDFREWWYHISDFEVPSAVFARLGEKGYQKVKALVIPFYQEWCQQNNQTPIIN